MSYVFMVSGILPTWDFVYGQNLYFKFPHVAATDLCGNTYSCILPWFQASSQAGWVLSTGENYFEPSTVLILRFQNKPILSYAQRTDRRARTDAHGRRVSLASL